MAAIEIQRKLESKKEQLSRMTIEIDEWLMTINDPEIASIIRYHFILGLNWRETNVKVYGYPNYYRARKKIFRYFDKKMPLSKMFK